MKYLKRRQINLEPFRYIELLRIIYLFFLKNKLFAGKPKLHYLRPKKELPHTRKYN